MPSSPTLLPGVPQGGAQSGREGVKPTQSLQNWEPPAGPQGSEVGYSQGLFSRSPSLAFPKGRQRDGSPGHHLGTKLPDARPPQGGKAQWLQPPIVCPD